MALIPLRRTGPAAAFLHMLRFVEQHLSENCSLQLIAREMNMNANYLGQGAEAEDQMLWTVNIIEGYRRTAEFAVRQGVV